MIKFDIDWSLFGIVKFIMSEQKGKRYKTALNVSSGVGIHTQILIAGVRGFPVR